MNFQPGQKMNKTKIGSSKNTVDVGYTEFYEELQPSNKLTGGVGDSTAPHHVDPVEFSLGQTLEMEHTTDPDISAEIALDHLHSDPQYYSKLKKAGLAKELEQVNTTSGFGDPDHPINDKKRLGSDITCTPGDNIKGTIGNTPDGSIEGYKNDQPIITKNQSTSGNNPIDIDINEPITETRTLPLNRKLWKRAKSLAEKKFTKNVNIAAMKWYIKNGGLYKKHKHMKLNEASNSSATGGSVAKGSVAVKAPVVATPKAGIAPKGGSKGANDGTGEDTPRGEVYDFFKYKADNSKMKNTNMVTKKTSGKVGLYELAKQILQKINNESNVK